MTLRIALVTQRDVSVGTGRHIAYGAWAEAEDVLIESADVELVKLKLAIEHSRVRVRRTVGRNLRRVAGPSARLPGLTPLANPARTMSGRYDLILFLAFSIWDLQLIERLGPLRHRTDRVAVWFFETWPSTYANGRVTYEPFSLVDDIYVALEGAVEPLASVIKREVTYLPMATDTIRFGPEHSDNERPIDMIGIGRRRREQHEAMLRWAADRERFYLYDTTVLERPNDYRRHRDTIGRWYSSSKLAMCNYGKSDQPALTQGLRIIPGRLWEGLASGAALVGIPPNDEAQRQVLGQTVVVPMPEDPAEVPAFLEDTIERHGPEQMAANVRMALTGHDWAHRWNDMFRHLGLEPPDGLGHRIADLQRRSEKFDLDRGPDQA